MPDDPWNDPEMKAWLARASEELVPKLQNSKVFTALVKGETASEGDLKLAIELGLAVLLDMPIMVIVIDNEPIPPKLVKMAELVVHIHERELGTPAGQEKIGKALEKMWRKLGEEW